jgi:hypothetical protein
LDLYGNPLPRLKRDAARITEQDVNPSTERAQQRLEELLGQSKVTAGLLVRVRGKQLTLVREEAGSGGEPEDDPRVRLMHLGGNQFGLSVLRHTGRWERTPFTGSIDEVVAIIVETMQHLVADWP